MKYLLLIAALAASVSHAKDLQDKHCNFVLGWANHAFHIARTIGLEESKWNISQEDISDEEFQLILDIKKEAYHDLPALRSRVEKACGITS